MSPLDALPEFVRSALPPALAAGLPASGEPHSEFRLAVLRGLSQPQKSIPACWLYDAAGSELFDRICEQPEYTLARTERALLEAEGPAIARWVGPAAAVIEPGAGSGAKSELLLRALERPFAYVPIDVSPAPLVKLERRLRRALPRLPVAPRVGDFRRAVDLPASLAAARRRLVFFPGSTIGNFDPDEVKQLLAHLASLAGAGGAVLVGVDLCRDAEALERAYDDAAGVTAAFNRNLLVRINREAGGAFDPAAFEHRALWNAEAGRVEMHLRSRRAQTVRAAGTVFHFAAGETIHTENSWKYTPGQFARLARQAGLTPRRLWQDPDRRYSLHGLAP